VCGKARVGVQRAGPRCASGGCSAAPQPAELRHRVTQRLRHPGGVRGLEAEDAHGPLREGMPVEEAAAVLWTLTSPEVHRMLRVDWAWPAERYERWLRGTLVSTLLPDG